MYVHEDLQSTSWHLWRKVYPISSKPLSCPVQHSRLWEDFDSFFVSTSSPTVYVSLMYHPEINILQPPMKRKQKHERRHGRFFLIFWFSKTAGPRLTLYMIPTLRLPSHCLIKTGCIPEYVVLLTILLTMLHALPWRWCAERILNPRPPH